jgi:hypothetical protein
MLAQSVQTIRHVAQTLAQRLADQAQNEAKIMPVDRPL